MTLDRQRFRFDSGYGSFKINFSPCFLTPFCVSLVFVGFLTWLYLTYGSYILFASFYTIWDSLSFKKAYSRGGEPRILLGDGSRNMAVSSRMIAPALVLRHHFGHPVCPSQLLPFFCQNEPLTILGDFLTTGYTAIYDSRRSYIYLYR